MMNGIKAIAMDVDGVLTDGSFLWSENGEELKRFSFRDVMGISRAKKMGVIFALISGEDTPQVDRFASKMGIEDVFKGCKDKASALRMFAQNRGLELSEICFMGDDINDASALAIAGLSAAPANAHESVLNSVEFVSIHAGGNGAVRELCDALIQTRPEM